MIFGSTLHSSTRYLAISTFGVMCNGVYSPCSLMLNIALGSALHFSTWYLTPSRSPLIAASCISDFDWVFVINDLNLPFWFVSEMLFFNSFISLSLFSVSYCQSTSILSLLLLSKLTILLKREILGREEIILIQSSSVVLETSKQSIRKWASLFLYLLAFSKKLLITSTSLILLPLTIEIIVFIGRLKKRGFS